MTTTVSSTNCKRRKTPPIPIVKGLVLLFLFPTSGSWAQDANEKVKLEMQIEFTCTELPAIPNATGLAGGFSGFDGQSLLFAGGANFPDSPPWKDGKKTWHDIVYSLDLSRGETWSEIGKLPRPLGYGICLTIPAGLAAKPGVLCCGGSDAKQHYADCFILRCKEDKLEFEALPPLLASCANASGVIVDGAVYVAGGIESPTSNTAMSNFWMLDLKSKPFVWKELPAWPGVARMLAVMSTDGDSLFLLSGAALSEGSDGKPVRRYLSDGYRYHPSSGWSKLADMPRAAVAAPSPAAVVRLEKSFRKSGSSKESSQPEIDTSAGIVVLGGDDGTKVDFRPIDQHPGFPSTALVYSIQHDSWLEVPMGISDSQVTTALIEYEKKLIIPSGEIRPGVRTSKVRQLELSVPR